jgi:hypothetical protein
LSKRVSLKLAILRRSGRIRFQRSRVPYFPSQPAWSSALCEAGPLPGDDRAGASGLAEFGESAPDPQQRECDPADALTRAECRGAPADREATTQLAPHGQGPRAGPARVQTPPPPSAVLSSDPAGRAQLPGSRHIAPHGRRGAGHPRRSSAFRLHRAARARGGSGRVERC